MGAIIDIYIPRYHNDGSAVDPDTLAVEQANLILVVGGLTVIPNVTGYWRNDQGQTVQDSIEIWRVYLRPGGSFSCLDGIDWYWWQAYKKRLEAMLDQDEIFMLVIGGVIHV